MTEMEKKVLEALSQAGEEIVVPESLRPENIEKMLLEVEEKKKGEMLKLKKKRRTVLGLAAACAVLVAGVIYAGVSRSVGTEVNSGTEKDELKIKSQIASAGSYDEVREYFEEYQKSMDEANSSSSGIAEFLGVRPDSEEKTSAGAEVDMAKTESVQDLGTGVDSMSNTAAGGFSDTNVRTEGVGEADIVKTDGKYLYTLQDNAREIAIVDTTTDTMKKVGIIESGDQGQITEFYVNGKQVFVLSTTNITRFDKDGNELYYGDLTQLETFDVSDITNPELTARITQSGYYQSSRYVGDYLYLFSNYYIYDTSDVGSPENYIPYVDNKLVEDKDIYLPPIHSANQYLVVSSVNINDPTKVVDQKAVLSEYGELYVSPENIYIYENTWSNSLARNELSNIGRTILRKISYKDGKLEGVAQTKVDGRLNDSFSIDEYEGNLRVITTIDGVETTSNAVFVLDKDLRIIGKIKNLAKDERVYSARLFGDIGYFVTYRETDPLFTVDFSDPTSPKIIGSLKIPGFSEYLHFFGENQLLGIGMDTDEKSGVTNGMKISMFDITDPTDVKEVQKYTIEEAYYSDVFNDYRAALIDYDKNLIGFSVSADREMYYVFSYDKTNGFNLDMKEEVNGNSWLVTRGVYIEDKLYVVKGNAVESYRLGSFEKVDDILL
ncbi:beta-propeller domain-containing protein [Roseburia hominis]